MDKLDSTLNSSKNAEVEPKIMSFQNRLKKFAKPILERVHQGWREPRMPRKMFYPQINEDEEAQVPLIIDEIKNNLKPSMDDLEGLFNLEFQEILSNAITKVSSAKILDGERGLVDFFEGTYTIVVTTEDGQIVGGATNLIDKKGNVSELYEKYRNLTPYALAKSILQWALWLDYRHSNITEGSNYDYLKELMGDRSIFLGSTVIRVFTKDGRERWLHVGVAGAQGSQDLLERHFDEDQLTEYEEFGGAIDQIFANLLEKELEPYMLTEPKPLDEQIILKMEDFKEGVGIEDENITFEDFIKFLKRAS